MTGVVFLGPDPLPALGSGLPVICADDLGLARSGPPLERFRLGGVESSFELLSLPEVRARLLSGSARLLLWKSSARLEELATSLGLALANSPARVARRLESKAHFGAAARSAGLLVPEFRPGRAGSELAREAAVLHPPLVFQLAQGYSGSQTYLAADGVELEELMERFAGRLCRVSELVEGVPVTVTGVVTGEGVEVGSACIQLTGLPELTPHQFGSCGDDYARPVPEAAAVRRAATRAGEWLRQEGHVGVFGLDLVLDSDGRPWCIEVNPRLVASVPLFSLSARDEGSPGLLARHLACFGGPRADSAALDCSWSQVILYQLGERRPGVQVPSRIEDREGSGQEQLDLGGPPPGRIAVVVQGHSRPGRELARVIFQGACTDDSGRLLPWLRREVTELRSELELANRSGEPTAPGRDPA